MLTAVHIYNELGAHVEFPLDGSSQYEIRNIDGLGPVNASVLTSSFVGAPGGVDNGVSIGMRNPVMTIGFKPSYSSADPFGDLRRGLYPYLTPGMIVDMRFFSSNLETVKLIGRVESFENVLFSQDPEVQISVVVPYPYFRSLVPISLPFTTPTAKTATLTVENPGNVPLTGFTLLVQDYFSSTMGGYTLSRTGLVSPGSMTYTEDLDNLEETVAIQIVTTRGAKAAQWKLQSAYDPDAPFNGSNVLGYITNWLQLVPGTNPLSLLYVSTYSPVTANASLQFTPEYVGL